MHSGKTIERHQRDGVIIASCLAKLSPLRLLTPLADQLLGRRDNPLVRGPVPDRACCREAKRATDWLTNCCGIGAAALPIGAKTAEIGRPSGCFPRFLLP